MNIDSCIRKLAKNSDNLSLFYAAKDISSIKLFKNTDEFTKLQLIYLNYLYMYYNLNLSIARDEVSKHVLDNEIYEDSYLLWKRKKDKKVQTEINNKSRTIQGVFSRDNIIKFPSTQEVQQ